MPPPLLSFYFFFIVNTLKEAGSILGLERGGAPVFFEAPTAALTIKASDRLPFGSIMFLDRPPFGALPVVGSGGAAVEAAAEGVVAGNAIALAEVAVGEIFFSHEGSGGHWARPSGNFFKPPMTCVYLHTPCKNASSRILELEAIKEATEFL